MPDQPDLKHPCFLGIWNRWKVSVRKSFGKQFNLSSRVLDLIMKSGQKVRQNSMTHIEGDGLVFALKMGYNHVMQML